MTLQRSIYAKLFPSLAPNSFDMGGFQPNDNSDIAGNDAIMNRYGGDLTDDKTPNPAVVEGKNPQQTWNAPTDAQTDVPPVSQPDDNFGWNSNKTYVNQPAPPKAPKPTWNELHPKYVDPYPEPKSQMEVAANAEARNRENINNPTNEDHGVKGRIKEIIQNFLYAMSQTPQGANWKQALALGAVGAGTGAFNRTWNEKRAAEMEAPRLEHDLKNEIDRNHTQIIDQNIIDDNTRANENAKNLNDWRTGETARKIDSARSREHTSRMNAVAGMFKNIPTYDPSDPKFKELTQALGDVGLPLTPKDAKKKVDLKQDQRTGAWTVILTDPISGKQEARNVIKDGKPFASTPTVVMQGEYGMLKQNDQQDFTREENAKKADALKSARDANLNIRQQELQLRQQGQLQQADALKLKQDAFRQKMMARVKSGEMTQEDFDNIFTEPDFNGPVY